MNTFNTPTPASVPMPIAATAIVPATRRPAASSGAGSQRAPAKGFTLIEIGLVLLVAVSLAVGAFALYTNNADSVAVSDMFRKVQLVHSATGIWRRSNPSKVVANKGMIGLTGAPVDGADFNVANLTVANLLTIKLDALGDNDLCLLLAARAGTLLNSVNANCASGMLTADYTTASWGN